MPEPLAALTFVVVCRQQRCARRLRQERLKLSLPHYIRGVEAAALLRMANELEAAGRRRGHRRQRGEDKARGEHSAAICINMHASATGVARRLERLVDSAQQRWCARPRRKSTPQEHEGTQEHAWPQTRASRLSLGRKMEHAPANTDFVFFVAQPGEPRGMWTSNRICEAAILQASRPTQ